MFKETSKTSIATSLDLSLTLGFPFGKTMMAKGFSEAPVLLCTRAVGQWKGFRDIDPAPFLLHFLLHMEGNDLAEKEIVASEGDDLFNFIYNLNLTFVVYCG